MSELTRHDAGGAPVSPLAADVPASIEVRGVIKSFVAPDGRIVRR